MYRGVRRVDARAVIIKVLKDDLDGRRLDREYEMARQIDSPLVVQTLGKLRVDGRPGLVLEDFGGRSLDHLLTGPLPIADFFPLAIAITRALGEVHRHGIVHK
ncbi:MAG: hypothetical protein LC659_02530, partial [Myxococcales bacterium]|nr:hypothetical protein [Myxococcales bacterium]